jgi:aminoglycoside phosphotransferase (APT) family kinase protein
VWADFRGRYAADLDAEVLTAGEVLFGRLDEHLGGGSGPWTVVHGDYRLDNLLFHPDPEERVGVIDWQLCSHGPALDDVAYFLGAGLPGDERRAVEEDLVRQYHEGLEATGVTGFDWDRCWLEYRRGTWAGLIMAVAASMMVQRTDRGDQMFLTMARRHARHALDLDAPDVIGR